MTTFIILIIIIAVGIYLMRETDYDLLGAIICLFFGICLLAHSLLYFTSEYDYMIFIEERNAFEKTLNEARNNGYQYETVAIIKEVSEWNQKLALAKYNNKTIVFGQYIDDRIELIQPIK